MPHQAVRCACANTTLSGNLHPGKPCIMKSDISCSILETIASAADARGSGDDCLSC